MRLKIAGPLVIGLVVAGCASMSSPPPRDPAPRPPTVSEGGDGCGAGPVQDRVGRHYGESLGESIRRESGAGAFRVMRPGEAHTLEYRGDRLNVRLDEDGVITDIGCG
ncbi:I78 family peptidase inhibitor [Halomonas sp. EGI 63088]|uniref:I78 family peptidase inhibitor n=1 Tax=Halomonas flagellata TaxID=2920385 RepID=A0ABS9RVJ1_9GAMM|nr:I78 family peptidase inhibitor [Halomonas flagellata]MCH4563869.1 I78 family peptidase inhibitor [Halomonas flagellata]